jgi:hypothetical protein
MRYELTDHESAAITLLVSNEPQYDACGRSAYTQRRWWGFAFGRIVSRSAGELGPLPQAKSLSALAKQEI